MAAQLIRDSYEYMEVSYSDSVECPVDCEYFLPDYCPDIQKILKCISLPQIVSYTISDDKINVFGTVNITILYLDEKAAEIRSCEISKEFTSTIKAACSAENASAVINVGSGHILCRAISARKLDIHIPVVLYPTIYEKKRQNVPTNAYDIEKKLKTIECQKAVGIISSEVVISQELALPANASPVETLLRKSASFSSVNCKFSEGVVEVNAFADISLAYKNVSGNTLLDKMDFQIPMSWSEETMEFPPDSLCRCDITCGEISVQPKEDAMGEATVFSVYMKAYLNIIATTATTVNVVQDVYSVDYMSMEKYGKEFFYSYEPSVKNKILQEVSLSTEEAEKIIDIWCSEVTLATYPEPGKISYRGRYNLSTLYSDKNGRINISEKYFDINFSGDYNDSITRKAHSIVRASVSDYKIVSQSEISVRVEIESNSFIAQKEASEVVTDFEIFENKPYDAKGKVFVCYRNECKNIWEIGKKYRIPTAKICEINGITEEEQIKYPLMLFR